MTVSLPVLPDPSCESLDGSEETTGSGVLEEPHPPQGPWTSHRMPPNIFLIAPSPPRCTFVGFGLGILDRGTGGSLDFHKAPVTPDRDRDVLLEEWRGRRGPVEGCLSGPVNRDLCHHVGTNPVWYSGGLGAFR